MHRPPRTSGRRCRLLAATEIQPPILRDNPFFCSCVTWTRPKKKRPSGTYRLPDSERPWHLNTSSAGWQKAKSLLCGGRRCVILRNSLTQRFGSTCIIEQIHQPQPHKIVTKCKKGVFRPGAIWVLFIALQNPLSVLHLRVRAYTLPWKNYAVSDSMHRGRHFLPSYASQLAKPNSEKVRPRLGNSRNFAYFDSKSAQN